jgi:hypothetical protein
MASTPFRSSAETARPVNVALLGKEEATGLMEFPMQLHAPGADTSAYSESRLREWRSMPDHYVLGVRENQPDASERLTGLVLCHADGEDFIADGFMLNTLALGRAVEPEIVRTLGKLAVASGCGAVVLRYAKVDGDGAVASFYRSLGVAFETLATGEQEVAFAWQALDWLLEKATQLQQYLLPWTEPEPEAAPVPERS